MRVVVCTDRIGALASADAGAALGRAFLGANPGVQVAVVPMGASGDDLRRALDALGRDWPVVSARGAASDVIDESATSYGLGRSLAGALASRPTRVVVDLAGVGVHDGGAGLLAALGATADVPLDAGVGPLAGLGRLDLTPARVLVGETEIVAVVPTAQLGDLLLGLRGLTARRGHATGADPAFMLRTDAALGRLAAALGLADAPGSGAAGGVPLALAALGGWTTSGPALCAQAAGLERTASVADVVVTGSDHVDFATRGGEVVGEVAAVAGRTLRPCVAVARRVDVSGRELRTFGVEVAYAIGGGADLDSRGLTDRARGVAASWTW